MTDKELAVIKDEITCAVRATVREELARVIPLTEDEQISVKNFLITLRARGDGNLSTGIETMLANHKWISAQRQTAGRITSIALYVLVTSIVSGLLIAMVRGVKTAIPYVKG